MGRVSDQLSLQVIFRPNVITLIGFIVATTPFILLFVNYGTKFQDEAGIEVPNWFFIYQAISYFAYRMLDEMDGK